METRIKSFSQFIGTEKISENLKYHINNDNSIAESVFRPGSNAHITLLCEARELFFEGSLELGLPDRQLFESTDLGLTVSFRGHPVPLDLPLENLSINEEDTVKLNYPQRGGKKKKYHVYVKNPKTGRVMKIAFGDVHGGLTAKVSDPKARKSFAARHNCADKKDRTTAGYWACRINRYAHLWGGKTYPGFW
jgi:hypothetical protein